MCHVSRVRGCFRVMHIASKANLTPSWSMNLIDCTRKVMWHWIKSCDPSMDSHAKISLRYAILIIIFKLHAWFCMIYWSVGYPFEWEKFPNRDSKKNESSVGQDKISC